MGLFDIFGNKGKEKELTPEEVQRAILQYMGGGLVVPEDNSKSYIVNGYNMNVVVHSAVRYITRRASEIPVNVVRTDRSGNKEYLMDHPVAKLLRNPNPVMNYQEFCEQALGFYLLTGNTFEYAIKSTTREGGYPIEIYPLPTQFVDIKVKGGVGGQMIEGYQLNTISQQTFDPENIIHLRTPNYEYENGQWLYGISPLKAGLNALNASNSNQTALSKLMQNLGAIGLLMYSPENKKPQPSEGQLRQMQNFIRKNIQGDSNRGSIRALSSLFKWQSIGLSAQELEIVESNKVTSRQLYAIYGLDSKLFNDDSASTYNNMQEAKKSAYTEAIIPTLQAFINKLSDYIFADEPDLCLKLDLSNIDVLKQDQTALIQALQNAYFIPTSMKQEMIGFEPDGVLPEYFIPMGLQDVDSVPIDGETEKRLAEIVQRSQKKIEVLKASQEEINERFDEYKRTVNMTASELEAWGETECSKEASQDRSPITRNLELLRTNKSDWTDKHYDWAGRTISFVSRMRGNERGEPAKEGCPSKRDISLKNWAFDPSK